VTTMTFGPGVNCASPKMSLNCGSVIQCCTSTAKRWISGTAELAPPMANSDISAKNHANVPSVPPNSFIATSPSSPQPGERETDRQHHDEHDRQRPLRDADGAKSRERDDWAAHGAITEQRQRHLHHGRHDQAGR